jgi:RNA polymerase sigma-70 factor (sigma-E family)
VTEAKQQGAASHVFNDMESDDLAGAAALRWSDSGWTDSGWPDDEPPARRAAADSAEAAVAALYDAAAVGLIRLAYLMLGDRPAAEDVVQDAFFGLYRNWARLADHDRALAYVRSSVLNGCRSALRRRAVGRRLTAYQPPAASAEATALGREERREVMQAVRRLPGRQREALVLRFYLDLPDAEIARIMGLRPSSVRSATHRALKALGLSLEEGS